VTLDQEKEFLTCAWSNARAGRTQPCCAALDQLYTACVQGGLGPPPVAGMIVAQCLHVDCPVPLYPVGELMSLLTEYPSLTSLLRRYGWERGRGPLSALEGESLRQGANAYRYAMREIAFDTLYSVLLEGRGSESLLDQLTTEDSQQLETDAWFLSAYAEARHGRRPYFKVEDFGAIEAPQLVAAVRAACEALAKGKMLIAQEPLFVPLTGLEHRAGREVAPNEREPFDFAKRPMKMFSEIVKSKTSFLLPPEKRSSM